MSNEIDQMWRELRQLEAQEARAREARSRDRERIAALETDDATASEQASTAPEPVADPYPARTTSPDEQEFEVGGDFESPHEEDVVEEEGGPEAIMKTIFTILVVLFLAASYLSELLG